MNLVIDTSVFIVYALYDRLYRIGYIAENYDVNIYISDETLNEFGRNLKRISKKSDEDILDAVKLIEEMCIKIVTIPQFKNSPDPKDNFLFDIALQTNSEIIVSQEKALLQFNESPVPVHDIKWFKEKFPVPL